MGRGPWFPLVKGMSVSSLVEEKWQATIGKEPSKLLSVIASVETLLAYNESINPVIPTLLNNDLLLRELSAIPNKENKHFLKNIEDNWINLNPIKKALSTQILLGLFPEIDVLKNTEVLNNLKVLYEIEERPDEF